MTTEEKQKSIIYLYAEHEQRLAVQMENDASLKKNFERLFHVKISRSDVSSQLAIESDDQRALGLAKRGFAHLATFLVNNEKLDIKTLYDLAPTLAPQRKEPMKHFARQQKRKSAATDFEAANNNGRPVKQETLGILRSVAPKTPNQSSFMDAVAKNDVTFGVGPAGTGKTFLAAYMALKALEEGRIEKIFLARPAISNGKDLGALPGDMGEKLAPFMYPLYDELNKLAGTKNLRQKMEDGVIELAPIEFMRGRTFSNAFVIVDEAQNATYEQLKMALTRLGQGSKMVVTGDPRQSDLKGDMAGGFDTILDRLQNVPKIAQSHFTNDDIVRSATVGNILKALENTQPAAPVFAPKFPKR